MWIFSQSCACVCVCIGAEYAGLCVVHWFLTVSPFHYEREMEKNHDEFRHREHVKSTQTIIFGTILPVRECISVVHTSRVRCINRSFHPKFSVIRYEGKREREKKKGLVRVWAAPPRAQNTKTEYSSHYNAKEQYQLCLYFLFLFFFLSVILSSYFFFDSVYFIWCVVAAIACCIFYFLCARAFLMWFTFALHTYYTLLARSHCRIEFKSILCECVWNKFFNFRVSCCCCFRHRCCRRWRKKKWEEKKNRI